MMFSQPGQGEVKRRPLPTCDSTQIRPPCRSIIFLQMLNRCRSLRIPPVCAVAGIHRDFARKIAVNSKYVFLTENIISMAIPHCETCMRGTPGPWYLMAFPRRFWNSWTSCISSPSPWGKGHAVTSAPLCLDGPLRFATPLATPFRWRYRLNPGFLPRHANRLTDPESTVACGWPHRPRIR